MKISNKPKNTSNENNNKNPSPQTAKSTTKAIEETKRDISQDSKYSFLEISSIIADSHLETRQLQESLPDYSVPVHEAPLMSEQ
jgi:hypothetical protein